MKRAEALKRLTGALPELRREFGVARAGIFGSVARDEARPDSDIDVIVEFSQAPNFGRFEALRERLEAIFGVPVDLLADDGVHRLARQRVRSERVYAET